MTLHDTRARASFDGYNRERLARCLAARGLVIAPAEIAGVSRSGARIDLTGDRASVWVLPRWIEEARAR